MDPVTVGAAVQGIIKVVRSVKAIIDSWQEYTRNLQAVEAFMTFLDRMKDVLKEQRCDRVSRAGFGILQDIKAECLCVEDTATAFFQRHTIVRFVTGSATTTAEALRQSRVKLHEHWTLYLVSLSPAGAAPVVTSQLQITSSHSNATISAHLAKLTAAVVMLSSGENDSGAGATQQLTALKNHPPGKLSDEEEKQLATLLAQLQAAVTVPSDAFAAAATDTQEQLSAMRTAMAQSVASGFAGLNSQLEAIHQQNEEAALHMQAIFDQNLMACPVTRVRFTMAEDSLDTVPTLVPGCHCTVVRAVAEKYLEEEQCGLCQQYVPPDGELKDDRVALNFLEDLKNGSLPAIRKFDVERDFTEDQDRSARQGTEGVVRFGTLRGEPVAVKTVEFATADSPLPQQQRRCQRHVLLNSICTQRRAARASPNVCDVIGLCWGETCAHIAMPQYKHSLQEHVEQHARRGMPLHHVLRLCCELTLAVHEVHTLGILHGNISPSNVLLADDGTPRLIDFGLSQFHRDGIKTRTSMGLTPQYAPPEQVAGRVNAASDIYALGRTLAYAATGSRPSHYGQKLPKEPPELKEQLQAMTGTEEARKAVRLLQVIAVFEGLLRRHGPTPVAEVCTADALTLLAFGGIVDMGGREITIADGEPSERPATHVIPEKGVFDDHVHIKTWALRTAPGVSCWDLVQSGATLLAVTLTLPERGQLHVLNDDAAGTWQSVTVKGEAHSTVIITGQMVLERVTFDGCTLVATENADLTLSSCTFSNCQVAAMATGAGASVKFHTCEVHDCGHGIVATDGATVAVDSGCHITCSCSGFGCCIIAQGAGSSATVTGAALHCRTGREAQATASWGACAAALQGGKLKLDGEARLAGIGGSNGVLSFGHGSMAELDTCAVEVLDKGAWASCGGTVHARGCTITGGDIGLLSDGARVTVRGSLVERNGHAGLCVRSGGLADLHSCKVQYNRSPGGCGVSVSGAESSLTAECCWFSRNSSHGALVEDGGVLCATYCVSFENGYSGQPPQEDLKPSLGCGLVPFWQWEGTIWSTSQQTNVTACGFFAKSIGSEIKLKSCEAGENCGGGVVAESGACVDMFDCVANKNLGTGVHVKDSGRMTLRQTFVLGCTGKDSSGVVATGRLSHVTLEECTVSGHSVYGVVVRDSAVLDAENSTVEENVSGNVRVETCADVRCQQCHMRDSAKGSGVVAEGWGTHVDVTGGTLEGNALYGMSVRQNAKVTATNVQTKSNGEAGVLVDAHSSVLMQECGSTDATPYVVPDVTGHMIRTKCSPP